MAGNSNLLASIMGKAVRATKSSTRSTGRTDPSGVQLKLFITKSSMSASGEVAMFEGVLHDDFSKSAVTAQAGKKESDNEIHLNVMEKVALTVAEKEEYQKTHKRAQMIPKRREPRGMMQIKTGQTIKFSVYVGTKASTKKSNLMRIKAPCEASVECVTSEYWRAKDGSTTGVSFHAKNVQSLMGKISQNSIQAMLSNMPRTVYPQFFTTTMPDNEQCAALQHTPDYERCGDDMEKLRRAIWMKALTDEEKFITNSVYLKSSPMNDEEKAMWNSEDGSRGLLIQGPIYSHENGEQACFFNIKTEEGTNEETITCFLDEKYIVVYWDTKKGHGSADKPIVYQVCHKIANSKDIKNYIDVLGIVDPKMYMALAPIHAKNIERVTFCWPAVDDMVNHSINNSDADAENPAQFAICLVASSCNSNLGKYLLESGLPVNTKCAVSAVKTRHPDLETQGDTGDSINLNQLEHPDSEVFGQNTLNSRNTGVWHVPEARIDIYGEEIEKRVDFRALCSVEISPKTIANIYAIKNEKERRSLCSDWLSGSYTDEMAKIGLPKHSKDNAVKFTVYRVSRDSIKSILSPSTEGLPDFSKMMSEGPSVPTFVPLKGFEILTTEEKAEATVTEPSSEVSATTVIEPSSEVSATTVIESSSQVSATELSDADNAVSGSKRSRKDVPASPAKRQKTTEEEEDDEDDEDEDDDDLGMF